MEEVRLGAGTVSKEGIVAMQMSNDEGLNQARSSGEDKKRDSEDRGLTDLRDGDIFPRT